MIASIRFEKVDRRHRVNNLDKWPPKAIKHQSALDIRYSIEGALPTRSINRTLAVANRLSLYSHVCVGS